MFLKVSACSHTCGIGFNGAAATRRLASTECTALRYQFCCLMLQPSFCAACKKKKFEKKSVCVFGNHDGISEKGIWQVHNRICRLHMTDDGAF